MRSIVSKTFLKLFRLHMPICNLQLIRTNATLKFFRKRCYGHYKTVGQNSRGKAGEKPREGVGRKRAAGFCSAAAVGVQFCEK